MTMQDSTTMTAPRRKHRGAAFAVGIVTFLAAGWAFAGILYDQRVPFSGNAQARPQAPQWTWQNGTVGTNDSGTLGDPQGPGMNPTRGGHIGACEATRAGDGTSFDVQITGGYASYTCTVKGHLETAGATNVSKIQAVTLTPGVGGTAWTAGNQFVATLEPAACGALPGNIATMTGDVLVQIVVGNLTPGASYSLVGTVDLVPATAYQSAFCNPWTV